MGTGAFSTEVKQPGREADKSPQSGAKIKNAWSYTAIPPYVFMALCLIKHSNNFLSFPWGSSLFRLYLQRKPAISKCTPSCAVDIYKKKTERIKFSSKVETI